MSIVIGSSRFGNRRPRRPIVAVVLVVGGLSAGVPAPAAATTRYVVQGGLATNSATCTTPATACDPARAMNGGGSIAQAGDTIVVLATGGPINDDVAPLLPTKPLIIEGDPSVATRPIIETTMLDHVTLETTQAGTQIRHLDLRATDPNFDRALVVNGAVTVDDVALSAVGTVGDLSGGASLSHATVVEAPFGFADRTALVLNGTTDLSDSTVDVASDGDGVNALNNGTMTNVSITAPETGLTAVGSGSSVLRRVQVRAGGSGFFGGGETVTDSLFASGTGAAVTAVTTSLTLRGVTAVSREAAALEARGEVSSTPGVIDARDVIAVAGGTAPDVAADPVNGFCLVPPCLPGAVTISWSNFRTASSTGVVDAGNNQIADPLFVNRFTGDYHLEPTSPAIDAGVVDPADGTTDLDGNVRLQGSAPDLGAYESTPPSAPTGPGPGSSTPPPAASTSNQPPPVAPIPTPPDTQAPVISAASLSHRVFAASAGSTATAARATGRGSIPLGTTVRFALSEPATVRLTFARATSGRRLGGRCVKPTRKLRPAKACSLYVGSGLASLTRVEARSGAQSVSFTARVNGRAFPVGNYRLILVATDAAGNASSAKRLVFALVRRVRRRAVVTTNAAGSAAISSNSCYSGDGPDHWVTANGLESNHVSWRAGSLPGPSKPPGGAASLQIAWSSAHPTWIVMTLNGFTLGSYQYTCHFGSGGDQTYTLSETEEPQTFDNGHTCFDGIAGDTVWVTIGSVTSNTLTVGGS